MRVQVLFITFDFRSNGKGLTTGCGAGSGHHRKWRKTGLDWFGDISTPAGIFGRKWTVKCRETSPPYIIK
jgi:hypothetical protein